MSDKRPTISVLIPVYNVERYLPKELPKYSIYKTLL